MAHELHPRLTAWMDRLLARRNRVVLSWAIVLAAALPLAGRLPGLVQGGADPIPGSETGAVIRGMEQAFGRGSYYTMPVVVRHEQWAEDDPGFVDGIARITAALESAPGVERVTSAWNGGGGQLVGRDRHSAVLLVTPRVPNYSAAEVYTQVLRDTLAAHVPAGFTVSVTGTTAMLHDVDQRSARDLAAAERIGLPVTLLILLFVFRAPLAALLPLLLAMLAVTVCDAVLVTISGLTPVSVFAQNVATMIGLGVGIDYALFILSRWRQELQAGRPAAQAARIAASETAGAVLLSAAAVAVGFLALQLVDAPFLRAITVSGVCVVSVAALAAVTLLPVLLAWGGERWLWPATAAARPERDGGAWRRWAESVMRRPWLALAASLLVVASVAAPGVRLRGWNVGVSELDASQESRRGYDELVANFAPGWMGPTVLLVRAPHGTLLDDARLEALGAIARRLERDPRVAQVTGITNLARARSLMPPGSALSQDALDEARGVLARDARTAVVAVIGRHEPSAPAAGALVAEMRAQGFPEARGTGMSIEVGGPAAGFLDFDRALFRRLPAVIALVLLLTFVVLARALRSLVLPLKAIALNLLSVMAAFGFLVLVFQDGVLARSLGVPPTGGVNAFVVLMLFTILFGLSMDYEVFVLARIREAWRHGATTAEAVAQGLAETGGVVTSAALIMISIFVAFGFTRLAATRQFGLGLAFAVALDATLIRVVLVPALVVLAGRANWWWPFGARAQRPS